MIGNIIFFMVWTVTIFVLANRRVKELDDMLQKQSDIYKDCVEKLKLRSEQNDTLMRVIDELNKKLKEEKE